MTLAFADAPKVALVVEDDLLIQEILKRVLEVEAGFHTVTSAVPELALPLAEATQPTILLLDLGLPGMSGWSVLALLRQQAPFRTLPVLIVSAFYDAAPRVARLEDPWVAFLPKPFDVEELLEKVEDLVARHRRFLAQPGELGGGR